MRTFIFTLFFSVICLAQPFEIGTLNVDFVDASRNNRVVNTRIYYPANTAGANVPVTTLTSEQFPVLTFGHGFLMVWSAYANVWEALVPQGYILAFPTTESGFSPSHLEFARDLVFVNQTIKNLGNDVTSIFNNRIHPRSGVMGHSMGGGSAHIAASLSTNIQVILTLAAAETNPSAIQASANINIPTLVIAGGNDCVTPPQNHQLPIYNAIVNSPCKSYVSIVGGSHCQMANFNFTCNIGDASCSPSPSITREFQHQVLNQFMLLWLNGFLKENCENHLNFLQQLSNNENISFQNSCNPCELNVGDYALDLPTIYPNPTNEFLTFSTDLTENILNIYDLNGKSYPFKQVDSHKISISHLPTGSYIVKITSNKQSTFTYKFIKK